MVQFYMDPNTLDEDVNNLTQPRFLRKAVKAQSPGGTLTTTVTPGGALPSAIDAYRARAADLYKQGSDLYNADPDTTQLQEFAKQRGQQGEAAMLNALAAQFAGEQFQPVQSQFLKKAASSQEPMKIGSGMLTPEGQYIKDPFAAQDKKAEFLLQQAKAYEALAQNADTARERLAAQRQAQEMLAQLKMMGLSIAQQGLELRRENSGGAFTQSGFTPDGKQLVTNKTGMNFVLEQGPQGQPVYTPYSGAAIPKATFDKNVGAVQEALASANRADAIIAQVDANPDAFGIKAAAVSRLPQAVQGRVGSMVLDEDTMKLRSDVLRNAAMEISSLYGAALSLGEQARANTFIPNQDDPPATIIQKLKAARDWAKGTAQQFGGGVLNAAQARSGGGQAAPAPAAGGLSPAEQAELEQLRKKHRGG